MVKWVSTKAVALHFGFYGVEGQPHDFLGAQLKS